MRPIWIALLLLLPPAAGEERETEREQKARELFEKAVAGAQRGQYKKAHNTYKRIAREYPETGAGRRAASRAGASGFLCASDLLRNGPSRNRVDVVAMGDGFTISQQDDFDSLSKVVTRNFERYEVLEEYLAYHNFIRVNLVSAESGVDGHGRTYDTALGSHRSGMIQGQVSVRRERVRAMLREVEEHDELAIAFVKNGDLGTGGGGIASVGGRSPKTMVHEWGHAFGGLMDEYSSNTGHRGQVNNGPNVSRTGDKKQVPWAHWLKARVSGIGVYQGADGRPKGAWKPTNNCIMDVGVDFCPVCREALILEIYRRVDPIEESLPAPHTSEQEAIVVDKSRSVRELEPVEFRVEVMRPKKHGLLVSWWVLPVDEAPGPAQFDVDRSLKDRRDRGPLAVIDAKPVERSRKSTAHHLFRVDPRDYPPGRYRVICRVRDETRVRGGKTPWVLADPLDLLASERSWYLTLSQ